MAAAADPPGLGEEGGTGPPFRSLFGRLVQEPPVSGREPSFWEEGEGVSGEPVPGMNGRRKAEGLHGAL